MTKTKTVFMFSGQGSQYFQMGQALFEHDPVFRDWMLRLDVLARELSGHSIVEALYLTERPKSEVFSRTLLTNPAILMVEYSLAQSLLRAGIQPDITLGASLGSFAAAAVADFIDIEDALRAVIQHATTLESCCGPGGMTAVLAEPDLFSQDFIGKNSELAGINCSSHFVVASRLSQLSEIEKGLKERCVAFQRLPVAFAFHSAWIDDARIPFEAFMAKVNRRTGRIPMMCCDRTELLDSLPQDYFWGIARRPIRFRESIDNLERNGPHRYIDVGPSSTLATFLKYNLDSASQSKVHPIMTQFGREQKNMATIMSTRTS